MRARGFPGKRDDWKRAGTTPIERIVDLSSRGDSSVGILAHAAVTSQRSAALEIEAATVRAIRRKVRILWTDDSSMLIFDAECEAALEDRGWNR
jgi:hypothetical protein